MRNERRQVTRLWIASTSAGVWNHGKQDKQARRVRSKPTASRKTSTAPAQTRGTGKTIAVTLRLDHDDWETLRRYAFQQRTSIQRIALQGCALIVAKERLTLKGAS